MTSYLLTAFIIPSLSILNIWRLGGSINSEQKLGPWAEKYDIHVFLWDVKEPKHYSKKSGDPDDCTWGGWVRLATLAVNARSLTSSNCSSINKVDVFPHCSQTFAESFPGNRKSRLACLALSTATLFKTSILQSMTASIAGGSSIPGLWNQGEIWSGNHQPAKQHNEENISKRNTLDRWWKECRIRAPNLSNRESGIDLKVRLVLAYIFGLRDRFTSLCCHH